MHLKMLNCIQLYTAGLTTPEELLNTEITIFRDYVQVDVQTKTPGIVFRDAWERRFDVKYGDIEFHALSRADLIAAKEAAGAISICKTACPARD